MVGVAITLVITLLLGLSTSIPLSLITAVYVLIVLIALGVWVKPRLFNRRWNNPILTVILLFFLANALGFAGIIIAPILSIICQILWSRLVSRRAVLSPAAQISDLKERQALLRAAIEAMDQPPLPLVTSGMERLTHLMEKAEPILQAGLPAETSGPFPSPQLVTNKGE